jgi:presenilin-like A22 family membrane protease
MAAGIFIAYHYSFATANTVIVQPLEFSWVNIVILIASFLTLSFVLAKFHRIARFTFKAFLFLIIVSGSQLFFASLVQQPWDLVLALFLGLANLLFPDAFLHNLGMILGISGVAALLGLSIAPLTAVIIVSLLSIYDIIAVYRTKHMVHLAKNMIQSKAIFGFLIPVRTRDLFSSLKGEGATVQERFLILGSGDIGLPIMLASSLVTTSVTGSIIVGAFSLLGLFVTHLLFINQPRRQAMAALPPIATASIIGFFISLVV